MIFVRTPIEGVIVIEPEIYPDARGSLFESYRRSQFKAHGIQANFVQENETFSKAGTLRGLHFQRGDAAQAKLFRVIWGAVFDVAVDLRKNSATFGKYFGVELSAKNQKQIFIPRGFAHGFLALEDTRSLYLLDNEYDADSQRGILYDDPDLAITWPKTNLDITIQERDRSWPTFKKYCEDPCF